MPKTVPIDDKYIKRAYTTAGNVGALGGVASFAKARKIKNLQLLAKSLNQIPAFTKHRPSKTKFLRRPVIVKYPGSLLQLDLIDLIKYRAQNKFFAYILIAIDVFTKYLVAIPVKKKNSQHMLEAIKEVVKQFKFNIRSISHDEGLEFYNREVKGFLKSKGIEQYHSFSSLKAQTAERVIRTIKSRLWRHFTSTGSFVWLDALPKIVKAYNNSQHSSHKFVPALIKKNDWDQVLSNLYTKFALIKPKKPKFEKDTTVRISRKKLIFRKKYEANYSNEIFWIDKVHTSYPVVSYKLRDSSDRVLDGSYTENELTEAIPEDASN